MSLWKRLILPMILSAVAMLAGCGTSPVHVTPPPTGNFSNSDLSGTYVFSAVGSDSSGAFFALVGTLAADGNGGITSGTMDINDALAGVAPATAISSGSYHVTSDGRGTATLNTAVGNFGLDFVLLSSSHGLVTEYDSSATGSGSLDLQSTVAQNQIAGSYAFNLTGISSINASTGAQPSIASAGAFTLDGSGNITSGVQDFNNNGGSAGETNLTLTGSVSLATTPGVATLATTAGTFTFDVYPIDSSHFKIIEVDSTPIMAGDAFTQTSSIPSGANVFTLAGFDSIVVGPFTAAGAIVTDGNGNVTAGSEDINDVGTGAQVTNFTGSYTALSGGRAVLTLTGFDNGGNGLLGSYQFAAYPSSGGLQLLEIDNQGTTAGVAYAQTATSIASSQGYGLNLSDINSGGEEDDIAEFTNTNGSFTGLIDLNDMGSLTPSQSFSATYSPDTTISGRATIASSTFNLVSYVVDSSTAVFVELDNGQIGLGALQLQTPGAKSNMAATHLAVMRLKPGASKGLKRH